MLGEYPDSSVQCTAVQVHTPWRGGRCGRAVWALVQARSRRGPGRVPCGPRVLSMALLEPSGGPKGGAGLRLRGYEGRGPASPPFSPWYLGQGSRRAGTASATGNFRPNLVALIPLSFLRKVPLATLMRTRNFLPSSLHGVRFGSPMLVPRLVCGVCSVLAANAII